MTQHHLLIREVLVVHADHVRVVHVVHIRHRRYFSPIDIWAEMSGVNSSCHDEPNLVYLRGVDVEKPLASCHGELGGELTDISDGDFIFLRSQRVPSFLQLK